MARLLNSRYDSYRSVSRTHRNRPIKDLVNSKAWENYNNTLATQSQYRLSKIPAEMEFRPDLISYAAYGTEKLWWLICTANSIVDPHTELYAGKLIKIPTI